MQFTDKLDQRRQHVGYLTVFAGYVNWITINWLKSPKSICREGCLSCLYRDVRELRGYVGVKLSSANVARVLVELLYLAEISQYWRVTQYS